MSHYVAQAFDQVEELNLLALAIVIGFWYLTGAILQAVGLG